MLKENILWGMTLDPMSGKLQKQMTFLGSVLAITAGAIIGTGLMFAVGYAIAFLK
jgi:amino acid transporter